MKRIVDVTIAALFLSSAAWTQCIMCGPDAGPPPTIVGNVSTSTFRSARVPDAFPGTLGSATLTVRFHSEPLDTQNIQQANSTEFVIDYALSAPATITGLEIHSAPIGTPGDTVIDLGITPTTALMLAAGTGTISRQGPASGLGGLSPKSTFYAYVRTAASPGLLPIGVLLPASEFTALAQLTAPAGLSGTATGAITATISRDSSGAIATAEVRFDARYSLGPKYSANSPVHFSGMRVRAGGASGPIVLDAGLTDVIAAPTGEGTLSYRQQIDAANVAATSALETVMQDPAAFYFEIQISTNPPAAMGGKLAPAETLAYIVNGAHINASADAAAATADGTVVVKVVRGDNGDIIAALATLDWIYRDFSPGTLFTSITVTGAGLVPLDPTTNALTVGASGTGSIFQKIPLLAGSPLLSAFQNASGLPYFSGGFSATLNTQASPSGAVNLGYSSVIQNLLPQGPAIAAIQPQTTTPGSVITVYGLQFTSTPFLFIGGSLAQILYSSGTQINAIVPPNLTLSADTPVFVVDESRTSNTVSLYVDFAQPYIFFDPSGPEVVAASTGTLVRSTSPVVRGDRILIYSTGLNASPQVQFQAKIGDIVIPMIPVSPVAGTPGLWIATVQIPANAPAGMAPLQIVAVFAFKNLTYASNSVNIWIQ